MSREGKIEKLYKPLENLSFLHELRDVGMDDAAKTSGHLLSQQLSLMKTKTSRCNDQD